MHIAIEEQHVLLLGPQGRKVDVGTEIARQSKC